MEKIASFLTALMMTVSGFFFPQTNGQIYLYGESHSNATILEAELEAWGQYYQQGMRDLFVEYPYYTAEYLNLWMQAEDDAILEQLFGDLAGTLSASQENWDFLHTIKGTYPETVFHGTDVGHCYQTTGQCYLAYLEANGRKDSEAYRITQEVIEQGRAYYEDHGGDFAFREPLMAENFCRAYDALPEGTSIMGIYGCAHTTPGALAPTGTGLNMASQLQAIYGDQLHTTDLSYLAIWAGRMDTTHAGETRTVTINGKDYTAVNVGTVDLTEALPQYQSRTFWQVEDAYGDVKDLPASGDFLPYDNYPCTVEEGQVYMVEYLLTNGLTTCSYYRADGELYQNRPATTGFAVEVESGRTDKAAGAFTLFKFVI